MKRFMFALFAAMALLSLVVATAACLYVSERYGYQKSAVAASEDKDAIYVSSKQSAQRIIVIFPANLVSPWQYQTVTRALANADTAVIVIKPQWRLEGRLTQQQVRRAVDHYRADQVVLIGHSAGVVAACKAATNLKPVVLVAVSGYCHGLGAQPTHAFVASNDDLISHARVYASAKSTTTIPGGGHFFITDEPAYSPPREEFIRQLKTALQ